MKLKSISVGGFKNLKHTKLLLENITAVISPNNYGKSNLLEAIDFGTDFLATNSKERSAMMRWMRGIPINTAVANDDFFFEVELEDAALENYRYVRYGFSFTWFRDDGTGQRITDEWIDARATESVRYTSFLKRKEGKYRKEKDTFSYRKIHLDSNQLAIDVLSAMDDLPIHAAVKMIKSLDYHVCSSLDLGDRFQPIPIEYVNNKEDGSIAFDDKDVPHALFQLKQRFPDKYSLFLEAISTLFPEFTDVSVLPFEVRKELSHIEVLEADSDGQLLPIEDGSNNTRIPFRIRDEIYKIHIKSRYLNQPIDMSMMSTGTKRVFWLLANVFIASSKGICLVGVEELETSIHPKLLKNLLEILDEALENTSLIISSHSPFLVQYFKPEKIYAGMPSRDGTAQFKKVRNSRSKYLVGAARDNGMSVGEYLFELMAGDQDASETLTFFLED